MIRRDALKQITAALFAGAAVRWPDGRSRLERIGVQLYTLRGEMQKSVDVTLARVAEIGYDEVEFAGYYGRTAREIESILRANGLSAPSAHVGIDVMRGSWERALDEAARIGHGYIVVAWVPPGDRGSAGAWQRVAAEFNRAGEAAKAKGLTFAYHNHDFEFEAVDGTTGFDVLLEECDPRYVEIELDLYWITRGGRDPVATMRAHPGRFTLVHVKDMAADGSMADVGAGRIDFPAIFGSAGDTIRHFFVEHDNPGDAFASIAASYGYLSRLR